MPLRSLPIAGLAILAAAAAHAHDALAPHAHPHGASALLGLDVLLAAAVAAGALAFVAAALPSARQALARRLMGQRR